MVENYFPMFAWFTAENIKEMLYMKYQVDIFMYI